MTNRIYFLRRLLTCFSAFCIGFLPLASKGVEKTTPLSSADKSFIANAYQGGIGEIQAGELGKTRATTQAAKTLANRLVTDHQRINQNLKSLAKTAGVTLPAQPPSPAEAQNKRLSKEKGENFDKSFGKDEVKDHEEVITAYEKAQSETKDPELKAFIEKTLPILKEHLALAKAAEGEQ